MVFWDESGASLLPVTVGRGRRAATPRSSATASSGSGVDGGRAVLRLPRRRRALAFHHQVDAYDTDTLIGALGELRRLLGGQKATLVWDGLPAHRSQAMRAWLRRQRHWLVVEPLPGYAPELNPVEGLWSNLKGVELANLAGDTLAEVIAAAERGIQRIRATHWLPYSFLRPPHWNLRQAHCARPLRPQPAHPCRRSPPGRPESAG